MEGKKRKGKKEGRIGKYAPLLLGEIDALA